MMHRAIRILAAFVLTLCTPAAATAQDNGNATPPALLGKLIGHWVLSGTIAGQNTVHDVEAEQVLQGNYVRISETSRERNGDGRPQYEATVYVGWLRDHYVCIWLDNTEVASGEITCSAAAAADAIPFEFRDREGALSFANRFVYHAADDSWEWQMDNIRGGQPVPFARVRLRRR
jgi:hypothetical protein